MAKSPFKMRGWSPFTKKSPAKQVQGGGAGEAVSHWNKYKKAKGRAIKTFSDTPKQLAKGGKKILSTNLKSAGKQFATKAPKKGLGKLATGVVKRGAGRLAGGPAGIVASLAYGAYKSGQKHSGGKAVKGQKSFMAESKKKTKSIWKNKKSIFKK